MCIIIFQLTIIQQILKVNKGRNYYYSILIPISFFFLFITIISVRAGPMAICLFLVYVINLLFDSATIIIKILCDAEQMVFI